MSEQIHPDAEAVARRLSILKFVVVNALTAPPRDMLQALTKNWTAEDRQSFPRNAEKKRDEYWQPIHDSGLWKEVSPAERELAKATIVDMTVPQQVSASWRIESAQVLMWALGMVSVLPHYDEMADHDLLKQIP